VIPLQICRSMIVRGDAQVSPDHQGRKYRFEWVCPCCALHSPAISLCRSISEVLSWSPSCLYTLVERERRLDYLYLLFLQVSLGIVRKIFLSNNPLHTGCENSKKPSTSIIGRLHASPFLIAFDVFDGSFFPVVSLICARCMSISNRSRARWFFLAP